jgi:hypothetical protein
MIYISLWRTGRRFDPTVSVFPCNRLNNIIGPQIGRKWQINALVPQLIVSHVAKKAYRRVLRLGRRADAIACVTECKLVCSDSQVKRCCKTFLEGGGSRTGVVHKDTEEEGGLVHTIASRHIWKSLFNLSTSNERSWTRWGSSLEMELNVECMIVILEASEWKSEVRTRNYRPTTGCQPTLQRCHPIMVHDHYWWQSFPGSMIEYSTSSNIFFL